MFSMTRLPRWVGVLILGMALGVGAANAQQKWSLADMNRTIEQTNFVVDRGCSGTLVDKDQRLILTNFHCIDDHVTTVDREVTDRDGAVKKVKERRYTDVPVLQNVYDSFTKVGSATYISEIVAEDKKRDLAVLKIKGAIPHSYASPLLPPDGKLVRGETIFVVGNPIGNDGTVVEGIISNLNRTFEFAWTDNEKLPMIQFSGGIYGGNSGGALYNGQGQLIGVPAAGFPSATFIGLAVPVTIIKGFMQDSCLASVFDAKADDAACKAKKTKQETKKD